MSNVLIVSAFDVKKGIEYNGFVPNGNAFRPTENGRISINRSPFALLPQHIDILTSSSFTYTFEKDTSILLTLVVDGELNPIWNNKCSTVTLLPKDVQTDICSITTVDSLNIYKIECVALVRHIKKKNIIMRVFVDSVEVGTVTRKWINSDSESIGLSVDITSNIAIGKVIKFTLEAKDKDATVEGNISPSRIQITKKG